VSQTRNETEALFEVLVNNDEQYSLWPADKTVPAGWFKSAKQGGKAACLAYINEVWTDMRPLSVRTPAAA
jgi:MbtH protein